MRAVFGFSRASLARRTLVVSLSVCALSVFALSACTATQTREHTSESYRPPTSVSTPVRRVFAASPERLYAVLFDWLLLRSVEIEEADAVAGRIVAELRFEGPEVQESAVRMGSVRVVVTRTNRRYRSYWPFEAHCDACIIRRGNLFAAETELVSDRVVPLAAAEYEIAARVRALVAAAPEPVEGGSRAAVELSVSFETYPRSPPGIAPTSTGLLEANVFLALERALAEP